MANRPTTKTRLIPALVFEYEKPYLKKLPVYVPAPYRVLERGTDQYGYTAVWGQLLLDTRRQTPRCEGAAICRASDGLPQAAKLLGRYPNYRRKALKISVSPPTGQQIPPHMPRNRKKPTIPNKRKFYVKLPNRNRRISYLCHQKRRQTESTGSSAHCMAYTAKWPLRYSSKPSAGR